MTDTSTQKLTSKSEDRLAKYRSKSRKKEETSVGTLDLTMNTLNTIMENAELTHEERVAKMMEVLDVNLESEETAEHSIEALQEVKQILSAVISSFTEHNKAALELTKKNPMSKLNSSIDETFQKYREVANGRSDISDRLAVVDELLKELGGEAELVNAMVNSQNVGDQVDEIQGVIDSLTGDIRNISKELDNLDQADTQNKRTIRALEGKSFANWRPGVQAQIQHEKDVMDQREEERAQKRERRQKVSEQRNEKAAEKAALQSSDEYKIHNKIIKILDISSEEFKERLSNVAGATIEYIDDTVLTFTGVRDQLELLLGQIDDTLNVNMNISEKIALLSAAVEGSLKNSSLALSEYKKETDEIESSLVKMQRKRIAAIGDRFVTDINQTVGTQSMIESKVNEVEVMLQSYRDQLSDGVVDANEQLLTAQTSASTTGMFMTNKAQALGALAQAVVARGQYMNESEQTLGQIAEEFDRQLAIRAGRNDTFGQLSTVISDLADSLSEKNDVSVGIAMESRERLNDLAEANDRLREKLEDSRQLESIVNEELAREAA